MPGPDKLPIQIVGPPVPPAVTPDIDLSSPPQEDNLPKQLEIQEIQGVGGSQAATEIRQKIPGRGVEGEIGEVRGMEGRGEEGTVTIPPHLLITAILEEVEEVEEVEEMEEEEEVGEAEETQVTRMTKGGGGGGEGETPPPEIHQVPEDVPEEVRTPEETQEEDPIHLHPRLHLPRGVRPAAGVAVTVGVMSIVMSIVMSAGVQ